MHEPKRMLHYTIGVADVSVPETWCGGTPHPRPPPQGECFTLNTHRQDFVVTLLPRTGAEHDATIHGVCQLRSLWDMFEVGAIWFIEVERAFARVKTRIALVRDNEKKVSQPDMRWLAGELLTYFEDVVLEAIPLAVTTETANEIWDSYKAGELTWGNLKREIEVMQTCWERELKAALFVGEITNARFYKEPTRGWESVIARFRCGDDVEEARKCLALGRATASVFHLMKVVESGVVALSVFLNMKTEDPKANFAGVLKRLERIVQETKYTDLSREGQRNLPFLRDVLPQLHAVKEAWRDKVAHFDNRIMPVERFTEEKALEIHNAALALMKKLAEKLPKKPVKKFTKNS